MPKTILVANSKGGVGKMTIAVKLAYAAQNSGLKFDYYDLDRQGGSSFEDRQEPDYALAIVDTPGALTEDLGKYMKASDLIIVPTHMSYRDQQPLELMVKTVRDAATGAAQENGGADEVRTKLTLALSTGDKFKLKMAAAKRGMTVAKLVHKWIETLD